MTALDGKVKATGLLAFKATIDHAVDNGLAAPRSIDLGTTAINVWLDHAGADKWVDSIHVDDEHAREGNVVGREIVYVDGRLPLLGFKVQLRFSRPVVQTNSHLRSVSA